MIDQDLHEDWYGNKEDSEEDSEEEEEIRNTKVPKLTLKKNCVKMFRCFCPVCQTETYIERMLEY